MIRVGKYVFVPEKGVEVGEVHSGDLVTTVSQLADHRRLLGKLHRVVFASDSSVTLSKYPAVLFDKSILMAHVPLHPGDVIQNHELPESTRLVTLEMLQDPFRSIGLAVKLVGDEAIHETQTLLKEEELKLIEKMKKRGLFCGWSAVYKSRRTRLHVHGKGYSERIFTAVRHHLDKPYPIVGRIVCLYKALNVPKEQWVCGIAYEGIYLQ